MKRSETSIHRRLFVEELETRVAPSALVAGQTIEYREPDGDLIGISIEGAGRVDVGESDASSPGGIAPRSINILDADFSTSLSVVVREAAGDGAVELGDVNAPGLEIGALNIEGNVNRITAGAIGQLNVTGSIRRALRLERFEDWMSISAGSLNALEIGGGLNGTVSVSGNAVAITAGASAAPGFEITRLTDDDNSNITPVVHGGKVAFISINIISKILCIKLRNFSISINNKFAVI